MARELIPSDATIKAIRQGDERLRLSDGDGLYLLLCFNGGLHAWRFSYPFQGRRKLISLGTYPDTSLALARRKASAARTLLAEGLDLSAERKAERKRHAAERIEEERQRQGLPATDSFEAVAREWFAVKRSGWARGYADKILARFEADVFPWLGTAPFGSITAPQLLDVLRQVEARGVIETAHRALENCSQVCDGRRQARAQPGQQPEGGVAATRTQELPGDHRTAPVRRTIARMRSLRCHSRGSCCAQARANAVAASR